MRTLVLPIALLATPAAAQDATELQLAMQVLAELQAPSFRNNREYCGYLVIGADGVLRASQVNAGEESTCVGPDEGPDEVTVASFHTHGAFAMDVPAEFPSVSDIEGDEAEGIDGYIATPGGRLWYVDTTDMVVSQICGIGCLPQDPDFVPGLDGEIAISYTYQELLVLEGN